MARSQPFVDIAHVHAAHSATVELLRRIAEQKTVADKQVTLSHQLIAESLHVLKQYPAQSPRQ